MKNLNKQNFKNIALMGIASGTILSGQIVAAPVNPSLAQPTTLAGSCGNHCNGKSTAYRNTTNASNADQKSAKSNDLVAESCRAMPSRGARYEGCQSMPAPQGQGYGPQSMQGSQRQGYGSQSMQGSQGQGYGSQSMQGSQAHNCGSAPQQNQNYRPQDNQAYTQWETADNAKMNTRGTTNWNANQTTKSQMQTAPSQKTMPSQSSSDYTPGSVKSYNTTSSPMQK